MPINCIAIDDDPYSLESLVAYFDKLPDLKLVRTFTEPLVALAEISKSSPVDIIFMDVEMPSLSGIELANLLRPKTRHLVFTTAHARYAIDAFKVDADAYLLKPYSILHFAKTINNLYPAGNQDAQAEAVMEDDFFYIPDQENENHLARVALNELISIEEIGDNIQFKTAEDSFSGLRSNFIKTIMMIRKHPAFLQLSNHVTISVLHIEAVFGNEVFLPGNLSYLVAPSHLEKFQYFLDNNQVDE